MMITNLFVIANVKQLRTGGCFRILLPFFRTSWSVGVLNSAIFNSFHSRVEDGTILEGLRNFGGFEPHPKHPPRTPLDDRVLSLKNGAVEIHGRFGGTASIITIRVVSFYIQIYKRSPVPDTLYCRV